MKLPPLKALRAFEAAGRHQSFLLAANELHISAASISRFIKILEDYLGFELFVRKSNGVQLSEKGGKYYLNISPSLNEIAKVTKQVKQKDSKKTIQITSIPAIAETWLVSKLWEFQQEFKDIEINLILDDKQVDFTNSETDIWLTLSDGEHKNCDSYHLQNSYLTLVCNSEIGSSLTNLNDIFNYPLLCDIDWNDDWSRWFEKANVNIMPHKTIDFERYSMVINAAIAGFGLAIGRTSIIKSYLDMGTLVAPFDIRVSSKRQFYAVISKNQNSEAVDKFIKWFSKF